jgi:hypothetical protein
MLKHPITRLCILIMSVAMSCGPLVRIKPTKSTTSNAALPEKSPVLVLEITEKPDLSKELLLASMSYRDRGFTANCDYESMIERAKTDARKLGANCIQVTKHVPPNSLWSSCDQIWLNAYLVTDIWRFENTIEWQADRKLTYHDFKADTTDRPFLAVTSSGFGYSYSGRPIDGGVQFKVATQFYCKKSYFKMDFDPVQTLAHEQLHFDISELFARRFEQRMRNERFKKSTLELSTQKIYEELNQELGKYQDRYDTEVYPDPLKQIFWIKKVAHDLDQVKEFTQKEFFVPFK